jgi:hypothetical protein
LPGEQASFDRALRRRLMLAGLIRFPLALVLMFAETALRSGGTVHVVARKAGA